MLLKVLDMTLVWPRRGLERRCAQTTQHTSTPCLQTHRYINECDSCNAFLSDSQIYSLYACPIQPYLVYPPFCSELQDDGCCSGRWEWNGVTSTRGAGLIDHVTAGDCFDINVKKQKNNLLICYLFNRLLLLAKFHTALHTSKYTYKILLRFRAIGNETI